MDLFVNRVVKIILPVVLILALLVTGCSPDPETNNSTPTGTQIGDKAPDFQLENLNGEIVSLSELKGRPVMLNFWATWCPPCRNEMPYIQEIYENWTDNPSSVVVMAVNIGESASTARNYVESRGFSFPVLLDTTETTARRYRISGIPTTFFIDKDGIIQGKKIGGFLSKAEIESYLIKIVPLGN